MSNLVKRFKNKSTTDSGGMHPINIEMIDRIDGQDKTIEQLQAHLDITTTALSEIKATDDRDSDQPIHVILEWSIRQIAALQPPEDKT